MLQALRADMALSRLQQCLGADRREQVELLQSRLAEEQRRSQQLEERLGLQAQQSSSQISIKQVNAASSVFVTNTNQNFVDICSQM